MLVRNRTYVRILDWREPMTSEADGESQSRPAGKDDSPSRLPTFPTPDSSSTAIPSGEPGPRQGHPAVIELTTATGIEVDPERCRWTVSTPGSRGVGELVESRSREVHRFMAGVLGSMQRATRRATVRPVPKPAPKAAPAIPPTAPSPVRSAAAKPGPIASSATAPASSRSAWPASGWTRGWVMSR